MGLIFDVEKDKNISMMVETSGIEDTSKLDFTFIIDVSDVKYGFPCKLKEGKVTICIPPLSKVIKGLKVGKYKATLDVTGDKNYFLQPFNEEIELMAQPKVDVIVDDDQRVDMVEAITASISNIVDEDLSVTVKSNDTDDINTDKKNKTDTNKGVVNKMFQ